MDANLKSLADGASAEVADLTPARIARLAAFSAFVWLCAAMFIRFAGPAGIFHGLRAVGLYALTVPATIPLNRRARLIAGLPEQEMVAAISVTTAVATVLDGVAMSAFPELYGADPLVIGGGAIWLLWAIGVASALAVATSVRARRAR